MKVHQESTRPIIKTTISIWNDDKHLFIDWYLNVNNIKLIFNKNKH